MARTTLRSRSGDIVTAARIADRTGIVAASAPPAAEVPEPRVEDGHESTLLALAAPDGRRPVAGRGWRTALLTCAAAVLLVVGWIGGGTFGQRDDPTPTVAAGATYEQDQTGTPKGTENPVATTPPPSVAQPALPSASDKKAANSTTRKSTSSKPVTSTTSDNASVQARDDETESASPQRFDPAYQINAVPQSLRDIFEAMTRYGTVRSFGH